MSRMFLVNIPLMFAAVWKVLQMFVDDRVKAKIRFLRKADFHILHEFVDRDSLPESLGGKAKERLLSDKQGEANPMLFTECFVALAHCFFKSPRFGSVARVVCQQGCTHINALHGQLVCRGLSLASLACICVKPGSCHATDITSATC